MLIILLLIAYILSVKLAFRWGQLYEWDSYAGRASESMTGKTYPPDMTPIALVAVVPIINLWGMFILWRFNPYRGMYRGAM